ncbi:MAG: threonine/serine exporter family protein [Clostridia bacterium]|nr:threonine/serine exporter family protein [Clostridia bacterium]
MILNFIYAFFASIGFSVLFNIPRKEMLYAGLCGGFGWVVHTQLQDKGLSVIFTSFIGALIVGILSEIFAKQRKMPATVFVIPGIIPLVPGYGLYFSMLSIIEKNYDEATRVGFETLIVASVIASAIIIATTFGKLIKPQIYKKQ